MSELQDRFETAAADVQNLSERPSNEDLLQLYALYKQATEGDVSGKRPGMTKFKQRAKYDAWADKKGTDRDEAMRQYVDLAERLIDKHG
jgi:diazepam-binding inhibitor (GABA receptor modulator, acyl-CoA-binding protein)